MGKLDSYNSGRNDGLNLALSIVRDGGVEALEQEIKFRNATGLNTALATKDLDKASQAIKAMTLDTVLILAVDTLHTEFGFGQQRISRFIKVFNHKAECIMDGMATWDDYIKAIQKEIGVELRIRVND